MGRDRRTAHGRRHLARRIRAERGRLDMVALARESVRDQQASTTAHTLSCEVEVPTLVGYFDKMRLRRVLDNLALERDQVQPGWWNRATFFASRIGEGLTYLDRGFVRGASPNCGVG